MNPAGLALFAYAWWGFVPLYWKLLLAFPATELILYRVTFSLLFLFPFFLSQSRRGELFQLFRNPRTFFGLLLSGTLIGFNWFLYVWAVNNGHVIDSSLGYFINPLMNVAIGTFFLGEKMRPLQKSACFIASLGVFLLAWNTGSFPWIAMLLALSFALYGLVRKILAVPTIPATFFETLALAAPGVIALWMLISSNQSHSASASSAEWITLALCGAVTTIPLLAFAEAAKKLTLSVLGFFQFLSPSIQFLLGVFVFREPFGLAQWLSFGFIWVGLTLFMVELGRKPKAS